MMRGSSDSAISALSSGDFEGILMPNISIVTSSSGRKVELLASLDNHNAIVSGLMVPITIHQKAITVEQYLIDPIPQCLDCTKLFRC